MNEAGVALMGTGIGFGETRAVDAAGAAISSPLLEDLSIEGARGVLINITGGSEMTLFEVNEASSLVHEAAHEDANIIVGAVIDETLSEDELRVTVIATGLDSEEARRTPPEPRRRIPDATAEIEHERAMVDAPNVTPIRQEPEAAPAMASTSTSTSTSTDASDASGNGTGGPPAEQQQQVAAGGGSGAEERANAGLGFESPYEDELDTPAFLRKRSGGGEDDRDVPAFMRRGNSD
jgi:cell division protein FtsZ